MWPWYRHWHHLGWRWPGVWWAPPYAWPGVIPSREQEIHLLEEQAQILEGEMDAVKKRLEELKTKEV